jgi:pimeloyl-ACP methyl ester carboxylesterase
MIIPEGFPPKPTSAEGEITATHKSWFGRKADKISETSSSIVEKARKLVLKPAEDSFIGDLEETKTVNNQAILRGRETSLRDGPLKGSSIELRTRSGIPIKAMYFSASTETVNSLMGTYHPNSVVELTRISPTGPTVILCTGSDNSAFSSDYQHAIEAYLARGINVVIFDYPGVGLSEGDFSVKNSYDAVQAVYDHLITEKHVAEGNLLVEGYSMGSGPATHLAADHPNVNVLLRFPFVRMSEIGVEEMSAELSSAVSKKIFHATAAPILEKIARFALPYDNEREMQRVRGNTGIMIAGHKDMHDEELETKRRLLDARGDPARSVSYEINQARHSTRYIPRVVPVEGTVIEDRVGSENLAGALDDFLLRLRLTQGL